MKVAWSYVALGNLIDTNRYIAQEDKDAARKVIILLYEAGNKLKEFPEKGRIVPELRREKVREIFCLQYRIIYRIEPKRIYILTVRHMKQRLAKKDL
jgi:toxin ParE1/3/4